jgi:hypothetical protein
MKLQKQGKISSDLKKMVKETASITRNNPGENETLLSRGENLLKENNMQTDEHAQRNCCS